MGGRLLSLFNGAVSKGTSSLLVWATCGSLGEAFGVGRDCWFGTPPAGRPTRPGLPVPRGDAAPWRARCIVSRSRPNSKHKSGSLAGMVGPPLEA